MDSAAKKAPGAEKARFALKSVTDGSLIPLHHGFTVGRRTGDLVLENDPKVSGLHCEFLITPEGVTIHDLNSTNGVRVNGVPIAKGQQKLVEECSEICIGRTHFILESLEATIVRPVRTRTEIPDSEAPVLDAAPPLPEAPPTPLRAPLPPPAAPAPSPSMSEASFIEKMSLRVLEPEPGAARVAVKRPASAWQVSHAPMPKPAPAWSPSPPSSSQEAQGLFGCAFFVAANLLFFVWELARGVSATRLSVAELARIGGIGSGLTARGEWWRLFTALFAHAGVAQLASNMLALVFMGSAVAKTVGAFRFSIVYLLAGLGGGVCGLFFWSPVSVSVESPACILGVLGSLLALHAMGRINAWSIGRYGLLSTGNLLFWSLGYGVAGADFAAGLAGLAWGAILAYFLEGPGSRRDEYRELKVIGAGMGILLFLAFLVPRREIPAAPARASGPAGAPVARSPGKQQHAFRAGLFPVLKKMQALREQAAAGAASAFSGNASREEQLAFLRDRGPAQVAAVKQDIDALPPETVDDRRMKELSAGLAIAWMDLFQELALFLENGDASHRAKAQALRERSEKLYLELTRQAARLYSHPST